jgi:hypothetical protein
MNSENLLKQMLEDFESGRDRSMKKAWEIEGFITENFPLEHPIQELAEYLAQYRPGGDVPPPSVAGLFGIQHYCSRSSARCFA